MSAGEHFVVLTVGEQRFGVAIANVDRIVRVVEITPLPLGPGSVEGVINVAGAIVPVFNLRRRLHLPPREIELSDQLILVQTVKRLVALLVESIDGLVFIPPEDLSPAEAIGTTTGFMKGIAKLADGLILLNDIEKFLDPQEEQALEEALSG